MGGVWRLLAVGGWIALLVIVLVGFTALGSGPLAAPPVTTPGSWAEWAAGREPVEAAFAVLRLVVLALAWYLLGVSVVGVAVRLLRVGRLVVVADVATVPAVRRLLQAGLGLGLATAAVTTLGTPERSHQGLATAAVAEAGTVAPALGPGGVGGTRLLMQQVAGDAIAPAVMRQVDPPSSLPWVIREEPAAEPEPSREWEVQPGEHFWSIAEQVLAETWHREPTNGEIDTYWRTLVTHNRDVLADPENPDLVFPGQVFHIPAPPDIASP